MVSYSILLYFYFYKLVEDKTLYMYLLDNKSFQIGKSLSLFYNLKKEVLVIHLTSIEGLEE